MIITMKSGLLRGAPVLSTSVLGLTAEALRSKES